MSYSLVRKGLGLFQDDLEDKKEAAVEKGKKKGKKGNKKRSSTDGSLGIRNKKVKAGLAAHLLQRQKEDRTEANVKALLHLTTSSLSSDTTKTLLEYQSGPMFKDKANKEQADEKTVFTEEDFQNFEKEYFVKE